MLIEDQNRRRSPRVPVSVPVRLSTIEPETDLYTGKSFFRAMDEISVNISRGGLFLRTSDAVRPGQRVLLEINLPGEKAIETVGRVRWMNSRFTTEGETPDNGLGVEFLGGTQEQRKRLDKFLSRTESRLVDTP
ncbi:MAG: PilZ domain-containing protein [Deltaproteobacteria bacterium]|nr:PilZ domain-containing protein [Deltaproteobacteria bacterium]